MSTRQTDDVLSLLRRECQLVCNLGDTHLFIVKLSPIKFKANVISCFHAFTRRKGEVGGRPCSN